MSEPRDDRLALVTISSGVHDLKTVKGLVDLFEATELEIAFPSTLICPHCYDILTISAIRRTSSN